MSATASGGAFASPAEADVRLVGASKRFGPVVAVNAVSVDIPRGSIFSLLGPSGCGKTTTLRSIAGLETPDSGRIRLGETVLFDRAPATEPWAPEGGSPAGANCPALPRGRRGPT